MASLNPSSSFASWLLSNEEINQGSILTDLQKKVIQNRLCMLAEERLSLALLEENRDLSHELLGKTRLLQELLDISNEIELRIQEEIRKNESTN